MTTNAFEQDYDRIVAYIAHDLKSPQTAASLMDEVEYAASTLAANPWMHAVSKRPLLAKLQYREHFVKHHVILYKIEDDTVVFGRMHHQTRNYGSNVFLLP